ncbi:hypothetical protein KC319_g20 [Hortaea werneckii]|nr:hypothetical protein KC319_g20 [Hortaea werneckii]
MSTRFRRELVLREESALSTLTKRPVLLRCHCRRRHRPLYLCPIRNRPSGDALGAAWAPAVHRRQGVWPIRETSTTQALPQPQPPS